MKTAWPVEVPSYIFDEEGYIRAVTRREFGEWWPRNKDQVVIASAKAGAVSVTTFWAHRDLREWRGTLILTVAPGLRVGVGVLPAGGILVVGGTTGPAVWCTAVYDDDVRLAFHAHSAYTTKEDALIGHEETVRSPPPVKRCGPTQFTHEAVHEYLALTGLRNAEGDRFRCRLCVAPPCTRIVGHQWEPLDGEMAAFICDVCKYESRPPGI